MKDRFQLDNWPTEWVAKIVSDFPNLNRETNIFLAKVVRLLAEAHTRGFFKSNNPVQKMQAKKASSRHREACHRPDNHPESSPACSQRFAQRNQERR